MPKRPDTLETVRLSLELLKRIPKGRSISTSELHKQLSEAGYARDLRTIQRQMEVLSEHFDIERDDSSRPFRYCWKERATGLNLPGLSAQESLLLMLAERQLKELLPARLMKSMDGFFAQARNQLDAKSASTSEREWLKKVRVVSTTQPLLPPKLVAGVFEQVSNALYNNHWLDVDYRNAEGRLLTGRRIMPLGLAQQGARLYLVCRFEGYDNERCLALHRLERAEETSFNFKPPGDFDLEKFDNDGRFGYGDGQRIRLSFRITKDAGYHLTESPLSEDQQVKEEKEAYRITATVIDTDILERWLSGFGDSVSSITRRRI